MRCVINDSNEHLINDYRMIRDRPQELIRALLALQSYYGDLAGYEPRKEYFLEQRARYNAGGLDDLVRAALFVFLMRTCYNAVYSVNRKGELSMSFGN